MSSHHFSSSTPTQTATMIHTTAWALVPLPSPDEREYATLRAAQELRLAQIARLDAEIAPLLAALEKFEWDYKARLGVLQQELRGIRALIDRLEHRTARIHARLMADPNGILGDLFDREELREIGEMFGIEIPPSWFRASEEVERDDDADYAWDFFSGQRFRGDGEELGRRLRKHRLPGPVVQEMRTLYRGLARRFHPDLAEDDEDLTRRQEMMLQINAAWHDQDLEALRGLEHETAHEAGRSHRSTVAQRILWLRQECVRLDRRIEALTAQLRALRASDTFPLWFNPALGDSVISQRATTLRIEIATAHHHADLARDAFRQALMQYTVACG
jgi:hypothetical protein